jgi:hypothetical protein
MYLLCYVLLTVGAKNIFKWVKLRFPSFLSFKFVFEPVEIRPLCSPSREAIWTKIDVEVLTPGYIGVVSLLS